MPFFSRVFFAIACFFRLIFDGRFAAAVEHTKALPPAPSNSHGRPSGTASDRDERHAIPPDEISTAMDSRDTDSLTPPSSTRARDTLDDLVRKTPAEDPDDDDDDSIPPVSTESHNTGLRRRSPPKPNTVPPPPDTEVANEVVAPPTEPSPGTTVPPPSPDSGERVASSAAVSVDVASIAASSRRFAETPAAEDVTSGIRAPNVEAVRVEAPHADAASDEAASDEAATARDVKAVGHAPRERGALLLLALLQREGRFVDFLQQDVTDFDDEQIGAAARVVHDGCRRALKGHLKIAPIRAEAEGDKVTLQEGYDVQANKLVGNVTGKPPYKGSVQHRGWRAEHLVLPSEVGDHDPRVLAPAEVEL